MRAGWVAMIAAALPALAAAQAQVPFGGLSHDAGQPVEITSDRLEGFASDFGADFYDLPRNTDHIRLARREWSPPANYPYSSDGGALVPMRAGETVRWQLVS